MMLGVIAQINLEGLVCCGLLGVLLFAIVYGAAKWGTQSALEQKKFDDADAKLKLQLSEDAVERAIFGLILNRKPQEFVVVQRVLGKEFVQFVYSGEVGMELIVEMPEPQGDRAMSMRAEQAFARLGGWRSGGMHQASIELSAGKAAKLARELLFEVYGIGPEIQLGITRG
jgi:hypothetical protein